MKLMIGGILAATLLGLYAYSVVMAILQVSGVTSGFTSGFATTMTTLGALVSAVVIAELAFTAPGDLPVGLVVQGSAGPPVTTRAAKVITGIYLVVWFVLGLSAYIVGSMWHPDVLQPLTDLGQSWLGVALGAVYAYLGIKPTRVGAVAEN